METQKILLDAGSGGRASQRLISECFFKHFDNEILNTMDDAALLDIEGPIAMSTDSYTVTPLVFPGGSIGTLAVHGTVNDVAMLGAKPRFITCACIIEEGLPVSELEKVVSDMAQSAREAHVQIVSGDTKVVPRGCCDKLFINTTGIGTVLKTPAPSGHRACTGDAVLISGSMGDHGLTIMGSRDGLPFDATIRSDSAPLNAIIEDLIHEIEEIHVLRDPTRGGLATTLNEIAQQSDAIIEITESDVPIHAGVKNGASFLGLDPLYLANEGKFICILPERFADDAISIMRRHSYGREATRIGTVVSAGASDKQGRVILRTPIGGKRLLGMLEGAQLPRIC